MLILRLPQQPLPFLSSFGLIVQCETTDGMLHHTGLSPKGCRNIWQCCITSDNTQPAMQILTCTEFIPNYCTEKRAVEHATVFTLTDVIFSIMEF